MREAIDGEYWTRREAQERSLAECSGDPVARRVHRELADRYAALVQFIPVATSA